jgi:hypothetical protein
MRYIMLYSASEETSEKCRENGIKYKLANNR